MVTLTFRLPKALTYSPPLSSNRLSPSPSLHPPLNLLPAPSSTLRPQPPHDTPLAPTRQLALGVACQQHRRVDTEDTQHAGADEGALEGVDGGGVAGEFGRAGAGREEDRQGVLDGVERESCCCVTMEALQVGRR